LCGKAPSSFKKNHNRMSGIFLMSGYRYSFICMFYKNLYRSVKYFCIQQGKQVFTVANHNLLKLYLLLQQENLLLLLLY